MRHRIDQPRRADRAGAERVYGSCILLAMAQLAMAQLAMAQLAMSQVPAARLAQL